MSFTPPGQTARMRTTHHQQHTHAASPRLRNTSAITSQYSTYRQAQATVTAVSLTSSTAQHHLTEINGLPCHISQCHAASYHHCSLPSHDATPTPACPEMSQFIVSLFRPISPSRCRLYLKQCRCTAHDIRSAISDATETHTIHIYCATPDIYQCPRHYRTPPYTALDRARMHSYFHYCHLLIIT
jgi:hypothetical protein